MADSIRDRHCLGDHVVFLNKLHSMWDDFYQEDEELEGMKIDYSIIPWYERLLMRFSPKLFLKLHASKLDIKTDKIDLAYKLFGEAARIDIQPLSGTGGRGFIISLDNKFTLWFYQDGDHFKFDGIEMGEYENGEVTVFDGLKEGKTLFK